jgi:hypothetical protein
MAAKKGNKNAIGNSGGKMWGKKNRGKAVKLKGLCLNWATKVMQGKDEDLKEKVALRILPACIPTEVMGENGDPIKIIFDNAFNQRDDTSRETERDS